VIEPWLRRPPLDCSLGTKPSQAPTVAPVKRCQSPISTAQPEPGQHPDPTQTGQPGHYRRPGRRRSQLSDGGVQAVAARLDGQHRTMGFVKGHAKARLDQLQPHRAQPPGVRLGPGRTLEDQPLA
jgi:hypothetical protein